MIWFDDVLLTQMICRHFLDQLKDKPIEAGEGAIPEEEAEVLAVQSQVALALEEFFTEDGLVVKCLEYAFELNHIMEPAKLRMLDTLFSMLRQTVRSITKYNQEHPDFPVAAETVESYCQKFLIYSMVWCFSGDGKLAERVKMGEFIGRATTVPLPPVSPHQSLIDFEPSLETGEWITGPLKSLRFVPVLENYFQLSKFTKNFFLIFIKLYFRSKSRPTDDATDVVIPTLDTFVTRPFCTHGLPSISRFVCVVHLVG